MRTKAEMLAELRVMLNAVLLAHARGETHPRLARAQGLLDGYMRALIESGAASERELLAVVGEERARVHGPALRETPRDANAA